MKNIIIKKMMVLLLLLVGIVTTATFVTYVFSKRFREFVAAQILRTTWPDKLNSIREKFVHVSDNPNNSTLFSTMGKLLDQYKEKGITPELCREFCILNAQLKDHYNDIKGVNTTPKRLLRSMQYQIDCIQSIIDVYEKKRHNVLQG